MACPVCKKKLQLPVAAVENMPNNLHAIHIIKLENDRKAGQLVTSFILIDTMCTVIMSHFVFCVPGAGALHVEPWSNGTAKKLNIRLVIYWRKLKNVKLNWIKY